MQLLKKLPSLFQIKKKTDSLIVFIFDWFKKSGEIAIKIKP